MKRLIFFCAVAMTVFIAAPARADGLNLDKVIVEFAPDRKPIENITVTNQGDKPLKVAVNTIEVTHSDLPDQQEAPTDSLIAAPKAFELAGGESKLVRLVLRGFPDDMEKIYRVRFVPSEATMHQTQEIAGKSVQLNVIVSMGALIMAAPKTVKTDLKVVRAGDKITLTNAGNVTATLQREDFCTPDKTLCVPLEGHRIFPGVTWEMTVPDQLKSMAFGQTVAMNGKFSTLSYPAP
jgi:P pilus assembly chaperone PapD